VPELPEVETVKRGLKKLIIGKIITEVKFDWPKGFPNSKKDIDKYLVKAKIMDIKRRAKVLMIELDSKYSLVTHLKMTGQLVYRGKKSFGAGHPTDSLVAELPDKSTRVTMTFDDGSTLFFNDQRKFGWMRLIPTHEVPEMDFMKKVGPEPLATSFKASDFIERFRRRNNTSIKAALLDQTVIAGVGNIYADEALYAVKIHPETKVKDIPDSKLKMLFEAVRKILKLSIKSGGSTDRNYVDAEGKRGSYLKFARVFRREGEDCPRDGTKIEKIKVAGRGTHVCPMCQKKVASK